MLALLCGSACACFAQLGETKEELSRRYGACIPPPPPSLPPAEFEEACWFHHDRLKVLALFSRGKAVRLQYLKRAIFSKRGKGPMTDDEITSILRAAVKNPDWVLIAVEGPVRRWQTRDSSAFAYYFGYGGPRRWQGPDHALWVQTAAVDARYQAAEEKRRARFGKRSNHAMQPTASPGTASVFYD